jgi:hypothetical protein
MITIMAKPEHRESEMRPGIFQDQCTKGPTRGARCGAWAIWIPVAFTGAEKGGFRKAGLGAKCGDGAPGRVGLRPCSGCSRWAQPGCGRNKMKRHARPSRTGTGMLTLTLCRAEASTWKPGSCRRQRMRRTGWTSISDSGLNTAFPGDHLVPEEPRAPARRSPTCSQIPRLADPNQRYRR